MEEKKLGKKWPSPPLRSHCSQLDCRQGIGWGVYGRYRDIRKISGKWPTALYRAQKGSLAHKASVKAPADTGIMSRIFQSHALLHAALHTALHQCNALQSSVRFFLLQHSKSAIFCTWKRALLAKVLASTFLNAAGLALTGSFIAQNLCAELKSNEW